MQAKTGLLAAAVELVILLCFKSIWQCFRKQGKHLCPHDTDSNRTGSQSRLSHRRGQMQNLLFLAARLAGCVYLHASPSQGVGIEQIAPCATATDPLSSEAGQEGAPARGAGDLCAFHPRCRLRRAGAGAGAAFPRAAACFAPLCLVRLD